LRHEIINQKKHKGMLVKSYPQLWITLFVSFTRKIWAMDSNGEAGHIIACESLGFFIECGKYVDIKRTFAVSLCRACGQCDGWVNFDLDIFLCAIFGAYFFCMDRWMYPRKSLITGVV
jgi:hypothetical protein